MARENDYVTQEVAEMLSESVVSIVARELARSHEPTGFTFRDGFPLVNIIRAEVAVAGWLYDFGNAVEDGVLADWIDRL